MSSTNSVLSTLRQYSKPYHDKLEAIGISAELKAGSLTIDTYINWLEATGSLILGTTKLLETSSFSPKDLELPFPDSFPLTALKEDLRSVGRSAAIDAYPFPPMSKEDYIVVPVYTLIGNLMGTGMILRYVQKHHPLYPTNFVEQTLEHIPLWPKLKKRLESISLSVVDTELGVYIERYWEVIYQEHFSQQHPAK